MVGSHAPEVKAKESEALTSCQIDDPTLSLVQFHLQLVELLPKSSLQRIEEPRMARMRVHHHNQIVRKADVLYLCPFPIAGNIFGPLQHPIHLVEVDV